MKKCITISSFFLLFFQLSAQEIPLGTWRTHFSYQRAKQLAYGDDKIFCAGDNGLFYYNLSDNSLNILSKTNRLSDVAVTAMNYHETLQTLILGYSSGGIDLVKEKKTFSIDDLRSTNLVSDKAIKDIQMLGNKIFAATALGIIVISLDKNEILENYRSIGLNGADVTVNELYIKGDTLFAISSQGIQYGLLSKNLLDFNNWKLYQETTNGKFSHFGSLGNTLYCIKNDSVLIQLTDEQWQESGHIFNNKVIAIQESPNLNVATKDEIYQFDGESLISIIQLENSNALNHFIYEKNDFWLATEKKGLVKLNEGLSLIPNGPTSDSPTNLKMIDGDLYSFYPPLVQSYDGNTEINGYNLFQNGSWSQQTIDGFPNISDVAKWNNQLYFSSIGFGLYNVSNQQLTDHTNSNLSNSKSDNGVMISSLEAADVLWFVSYDNVNPIGFLSDKNEITNYTTQTIGFESNTNLVVTENGLALITISGANGGGFIAFEKATMSKKKFDSGSGLPTNDISNITVDGLDNAWVSTSSGIVSYPNSSYLLDFSQPVVPIYENSYLFEDEDIYYVKTDAGNNVWICTEDGLWVFNTEFSKIEHFFHNENSPLPSNHIQEMAFNSISGEMFIQTDKGMVSFRSNSSQSKSNYDEVDIYPNPVRPGYSGLVGISGLIYDTKVKITDINGKLIRELETNGGTTAWDLLDYNHQKVSSGVYLILTAFQDGSDKFVGKIAVIN